jgi:hypothetical protein
MTTAGCGVGGNIWSDDVTKSENLTFGCMRIYIVKRKIGVVKGQLNSNFTPFFLESVHFSKSE